MHICLSILPEFISVWEGSLSFVAFRGLKSGRGDEIVDLSSGYTLSLFGLTDFNAASTEAFQFYKYI
jgi:hypothetical protein